jgi:hypothetical protein
MKAATVLSWFAVIGFAITFAFGLLVPIYTDEIASTLQLARPFADGARSFTLFPQCESSWQSPLPLVWYPAAGLYYLVFDHLGPLGYRISSMVVSGAWLAAAAIAIARTTKVSTGRVHRVATFLAPHAVGVVPLTLVTARSEPILTFSLCAFVLFPLAWRIESRKTTWGRAVVTVAFCLVASIFTYVHSKALLFMPFVLVSAYFTFSRRRLAWSLGALAVIGAMVAASAERGSFFGRCAEAPRVEAVLRGLAIDPKLLLRDPRAFVETAVENLGRHTREIAAGLTLEPKHHWLPHDLPRRAPPAAIALVDAITDAYLSIFLVTTAMGIGAITIYLIRQRRRKRGVRGRGGQFIALSFALFAVAVGHVLIAVNWNFYSSPFVISSFAIAGWLAAYGARIVLPVRARLWLRRPARVAMGLSFAVVVVGVTATLAYVGPRLVAAARLEGGIVPNLPASDPVFGFPREREKIRAHAARCGLEADGAKRLVIDDESYFAFENLKEPVHLIYVSDAAMWGPDLTGKRMPAFLRKLESPGIISRCAFFPTALVSKARKQDGYCCVGSADLLPPPLEVGQQLFFGIGGNAEPFLDEGGWSWPEQDGRWSTGPESTLSFVSRDVGAMSSLALTLFAPLGPSRHAQSVDIFLNGALLGTAHIDEDHNDGKAVRRFANARLARSNVLTVRPHDTRSPREIGLSTDERRLGIWVKSLWFDAESGAVVP